MRETKICAKNGLPLHSCDQFDDGCSENTAYSTPHARLTSRAECHEVPAASTNFRQIIGGLIDERASLTAPLKNLSKDDS